MNSTYHIFEILQNATKTLDCVDIIHLFFYLNFLAKFTEKNIVQLNKKPKPGVIKQKQYG